MTEKFSAATPDLQNALPVSGYTAQPRWRIDMVIDGGSAYFPGRTMMVVWTRPDYWKPRETKPIGEAEVVT